MNERELIDVIEILNMQINNVKRSKEFSMGKNICRLKEKIIHFKFDKIIIGIINRYKLNKLTNYYNRDNWSNEERKKLLNVDTRQYKIAVYTCITGNYDVVKNPYIFPDNIDYYLFSENEKENSKWIYKKLSHNFDNDILNNRYVKMHPFEAFEKKYDFAIYIDGNIRPVSDISSMVELLDREYGIAFHEHFARNCIFKEVKACRISGKGNYKEMKKQVKKYRIEGFPSEYGMIEGNFFIVDLRSVRAKRILKDWWDEFYNTGGKRDQISIPYVLWKHSIKIEHVATLGKNIYNNCKLQVSKHTNE